MNSWLLVLDPKRPLMKFHNGSVAYFGTPVFPTAFRAKKNFYAIGKRPEWRGKLLEMIDFTAAVNSIKFSSKSELSSRFFGRLKFFALFEYLRVPKNLRCRPIGYQSTYPHVQNKLVKNEFDTEEK